MTNTDGRRVDLRAIPGGRSGGLAKRLEEILREQFRKSATGETVMTFDPSLDASPNDHIPFSIRVTMEEVLGVAEDADLRAQMLARSIGQIPNSAHAVRKVSELRQAAMDLRMIAAHLGDGWISGEEAK